VHRFQIGIPYRVSDPNASWIPGIFDDLQHAGDALDRGESVRHGQTLPMPNLDGGFRRTGFGRFRVAGRMSLILLLFRFLRPDRFSRRGEDDSLRGNLLRRVRDEFEHPVQGNQIS
jgi:hypothetical protein